MTTILLIRHGENDSIGHYMPGRTPGLGLNEAGKAQARLVAECLSGVKLERIISSPLDRTVQTATPLVEKTGVRLEMDTDFIEMDPGEWTSRPFSELFQNPLWAQLRSDPKDAGYPGGETFISTQERLWHGMQRVLKQTEAGIVAIFTHADCVRLITASALHIPLSHYNRMIIDTASLTVITFRTGNPMVEVLNNRLPYSWQPR
jgi:probable phosphoglycerate mutase